MMNLTKIENGYSIGNTEYVFNLDKEVEILSDTQCHISTDKGIIFFDTTVTIDNKVFETIAEWIDALYY